MKDISEMYDAQYIRTLTNVSDILTCLLRNIAQTSFVEECGFIALCDKHMHRDWEV